MSIEHVPLTSVSKFTRVRFLDWKKAKRTGNFSRTDHSQKNGVGYSLVVFRQRASTGGGLAPCAAGGGGAFVWD